MSFQATINKKKYHIKFSNRAYRYLGKLWNCKGRGEVIFKLSNLEDIPETGLTFEQEDLVRDLILAGIKGADEKVKLPDGDVLYSHLLDAVFLENIFKELTESFPKPLEGNVIPEKVGKKMAKVS